jgi:hypothetical protein
MPERIQRKRTEGWRKPDNAVIVTRPTMWGNPFLVLGGDVKQAVANYRAWLESTSTGRKIARLAKERLRGKNLACWCPLDQPCHADVLLEVANTTDSKGGKS